MDENGQFTQQDGSVKGYGTSVAAALTMAQKRASNKNEAVGQTCQTFGPMTWYTL